MNLDYYAQNISRMSASAIVLTSGRPVCLRFPTGDRFARQTTTHEELTGMLMEATPPEVQAKVRAGEVPAPFHLKVGEADYLISVSGGGDAWQITIGMSAAAALAQAAAAEPAASEAPAAAAAEPEPVTAAAPAAKAKPAPKQQAAGPPPSPGGKKKKSSIILGAEGKRSRADLDALLKILCADNGSDLHLTSGLVPMYRVAGVIKPVPDWGVVSEAHLMGMINSIMEERNREEYETRWDTDLAYEIAGLSRFRVNVGRDHHGPFTIIRRIPFEILSAHALGLPRKVLELCFLTKGLVLVTGPTGSGKSTTLATMVDLINERRTDHIITIEDPIEFVHRDGKSCLVHQREVGEHTKSFKSALRAALREDPDIVLVGEMRDLETVAIAIETAETGHLVFGTLHTSTAPSTVDRLIDQFPPHQQAQIRVMLGESLRGVISQTLCKKIGGGRIAAYEIMIPNKGMSNLIREGKTFQLYSMMQTHKASGNLTLGESLYNLVKANKITAEEAYMKAVDKEEFEHILSKAGIHVEIQI